MAGFSMGKMKRKELEEVYDDFFEFSLNSPARKIRRLDAGLPPIMEEEEPAVPFPFEQQMPKDPLRGSSSMAEFESVMAEDLPSILSNEERALVLYKPMNNPLALSPSSSNISFTMNSDFVHGLKNQAFWPGNPNPVMDEVPADDKSRATGNSLAMVPWVPSQSLTTIHGMAEPESRVRASVETMESEEVTTEAASMEVEEDAQQAASNGATGESFHQWQQHCMTPHLPQNTSTPIMWSWG